MILIRVTCLGINPSIQKQFFLRDHIDEVIFFNTYKLIKAKFDKGIRINLDETIWFCCGNIIDDIRSEKGLKNIKERLSKLLTPDIVMIGVVDIMKKIDFEISIDNNCKLSIENKISFVTDDQLIQIRKNY